MISLSSETGFTASWGTGVAATRTSEELVKGLTSRSPLCLCLGCEEDPAPRKCSAEIFDDVSCKLGGTRSSWCLYWSLRLASEIRAQVERPWLTPTLTFPPWGVTAGRWD